MTRDRSSIKIRAQEIIAANPDGITTAEAITRVFLERYGDDARAMAEAVGHFGANQLSGIRKLSYHLPEPNDADTLFDIPQTIGIRMPGGEGDLLISRNVATYKQVSQWVDEGCQHHGTQQLRFKRARAELDRLGDVPDDLPWIAAKELLPDDEEEGQDEE